MRDGATRRQRWTQLRRSLWQPPRAHGEQPRERAVGPLELFYDLAVVVLVAQAAHHLAGHLTWPGLGEFIAVFTATAWVLCGGAAVVLCATMLLAASLQTWNRDLALYRPLVRACAVVAVACLAIGAARPAPLILGLALVLLLGIRWGFAVARRLASDGG